MASTTKAHWTKRANKNKNLGKERKRKLAREGSTPSKAKLFGDGTASK